MNQLRRTHRILLALISLNLASCGSDPQPPSVQRQIVFEPVELSTILADPARFNGARVRISGLCRIEFEGNAVYVNKAAFEQRASAKALWLDLGWPVANRDRLDGHDVVVEGTIDSVKKGHEAAFAASLVQITRIETR